MIIIIVDDVDESTNKLIGHHNYCTQVNTRNISCQNLTFSYICMRLNVGRAISNTHAQWNNNPIGTARNESVSSYNEMVGILQLQTQLKGASLPK